jgi:RimJ/RimL family protein N-acetyltransferase
MRYGDDLLKGEQVRLAALTKDDVAVFGPWYESVELLRMLNSGAVRPFSLEDEAEWYESARKQHNLYQFGIRLLADNRLIGTCTVMDINWPARSSMVGISIGAPDARGKGYGTDAMRVLLRYCFMELNLNRVGLTVFSYNTRAMTSYRKVGFQQEGVMRQAILRDGEYHDIVLMSILRSEWDMLQDEPKP